MKTRARIVGHGEDGTPVINGDLIFEMMDSHGLPVEFASDVLRRHGLAFDVAGFVRAALASGNFRSDRIRRAFIDTSAPMPLVDATICRVVSEEPR